MNNKLAEDWSGEIWGTNSGAFFLQIRSTQKRELAGVLRINDPTFGLNVYSVLGTFDGSRLELIGTPTASAPNTQLGTIRVQGHLQANNNIKGSWESAISTGGKFSMTPHSSDSETQENTSDEDTGSMLNASERDRPMYKILGIEVWKIVSGVLIGVFVILLAAYLIPKLGLSPLT